MQTNIKRINESDMLSYVYNKAISLFEDVKSETYCPSFVSDVIELSAAFFSIPDVSLGLYKFTEQIMFCLWNQASALSPSGGKSTSPAP